MASEHPGPIDHPQLFSNLVHAAYWLDDGLQAYMRKHTGMSLPRAQSMMMVYLVEGVDRPSDLARRLRVSKQAVAQALKELAAKDMVAMVPDPNNGRQKIVTITEHGRELRAAARRALEALQNELEQRIGRERLAVLEDVLATDWGPVPEDL